MFKELKNNKGVCQQIFVCCAFFFSIFSFFTVCGTIPLDVELRQCSQKTDNSYLAPFPGGEADDEAAVRWNYQCRTNMAIRLDNRNTFRSSVPTPGNGAEVETVVCVLVPFPDKFLWRNQPLKTYYRRLWQKILPSRAGPCA